DLGVYFGHGHTDQLFAAVAEALARLAIHVDEDAALVAQRERVGRMIHQGAEALLARPQPPLGALSILDVDTGSVPLDYARVFVTQRDLGMEHPAKFSVGAPHAGFVQEGLAAGQRGAPCLQHGPEDTRVNLSVP